MSLISLVTLVIRSVWLMLLTSLTWRPRSGFFECPCCCHPRRCLHILRCRMQPFPMGRLVRMVRLMFPVRLHALPVMWEEFSFHDKFDGEILRLRHLVLPCHAECIHGILPSLILDWVSGCLHWWDGAPYSRVFPIFQVASGPHVATIGCLKCWKITVSPAKSLTSEDMLSGKLLMYTRNNIKLTILRPYMLSYSNSVVGLGRLYYIRATFLVLAVIITNFISLKAPVIWRRRIILIVS